MTPPIIKLAVGCILAMLMLACSSSHEPIKIGSNVWPGYALYYLAQEQGYISSDQVRLVEYQNATFSSDAFINHDLDAVMLTLDEALRIQELGIDLTIIQVIDVSRGADVVMSQVPLIELHDFTEKTIAVERSAVGALMLAAFQDYFEIPDNTLEIIDSSVEESLSAYEQGIDFVVTFVPFSKHIGKKGGYQVFDTSIRPNLVVDVLVIRSDLMTSQYEKTLTQMIHGFFRAQELLRTRPSEVFPYLQKRLQLSAEEVAASYEVIDLTNLAQNRGMLSGSNAGLHYIVKEVHSILSDSGYLDQPPPQSSFFTDRFLPQGP